MKKKPDKLCSFWHSWLKRTLAMKFILMLTMVFGVLSSASTYSQRTKLTLNLEEATILEIFQKIEETTEFGFFFRSEDLDLNKRYYVNLENVRVDEVLSIVLKDETVDYTIEDRNIILTKKDTVTTEQPQSVITGKVTDTDGEPIPGVTIQVQGTSTGTITDVDGNYELKGVAEDAVIVFSFVGYVSVEIPVAGQETINVSMRVGNIQLEEVVAIGYGFKKRVNLTGSVASVSSDVLEKVPPIASTTNALAGRLPGLISKQTSGSPGRDAATLAIRGFGNPLIIVDGVEGNFNDIDPNEIESISVLKDASAAIFGARAGNGVLLVTTKRGKLGKPTIKLNSSYSFQTITNFPEPMSAGQFAEYDRESKTHRGYSEAQQWFTQEEVEKYYAGTDPDYPNTDWYDVLIRSYAPMSHTNLSVSGGSDRIKYYGLLGYMHQETFWKNNGGDYKRFNIRSNIDAQITNALSLQLDLSNINVYRKFPGAEDQAGVGDYWMWRDFWQTWPIYPSSLPDDSKIPYTGLVPGGALHSTNRELSGFFDTDRQEIKAGATLRYDFPFVKGLSAKLFINYVQDYTNTKKMNYPVDLWSYSYASDTYTLEAEGSPASLRHTDSKNRMITNRFTIDYDRVFAKNHTVVFMALYESIDYSYDYITAERINFLTPSIEYLFGGSIQNQYANGSATEMGRESYIGRLSYSFKNKYLFEATLRADASAKFPSEKRWGYFPSLSVGWRISEEGFIKDNIDWLENLKLRGSISNAGYDNVGNFAYLSGYQLNQKYVFGSDIMDGLRSTGLPNPNLTWEKMSILNLGLDFSLYKSKLYGEFDGFYRKRDGIPATRATSLPSTFGANLPSENLNSTIDRGFEALIGTRGNKGNFLWDISGNVSWSRAKWDHFEEPDYSDDAEMARVYQICGQWTDRIMGYKTDGLYTSQEEIDAMTFDQDQQGNITIKPGDIKYIDHNKDGVLDWKDRVEIGNGSSPHWMFGLTTVFSYKNFDLSLLFQGAAGNYVSVQLPWCEQLFKGRWTEENNDPNAIFPRSGSIAQGGGFSDFYLKEAGYFRLKTLNLGYNLPKNILNFARIGNLRISFSATNLFTFDRLKEFGLDPEAPGTEGQYYSNNAFFYPQQRTYTFGLTLTL